MGQVSALNPNAPAFVPMAYYDAVEDFSDQWWNLVQSSPYFRDYWLEECFQDPDEYDEILFHDIDFIFYDQQHLSSKQEEEEVEREKRDMDLVSLEKLKWERDHKARSGEIESLRKLREKTPKIVNVKLSPRTINQPR